MLLCLYFKNTSCPCTPLYMVHSNPIQIVHSPTMNVSRLLRRIPRCFSAGAFPATQLRHFREVLEIGGLVRSLDERERDSGKSHIYCATQLSLQLSTRKAVVRVAGAGLFAFCVVAGGWRIRFGKTSWGPGDRRDVPHRIFQAAEMQENLLSGPGLPSLPVF
jgi:hypothetical protein